MKMEGVPKPQSPQSLSSTDSYCNGLREDIIVNDEELGNDTESIFSDTTVNSQFPLYLSKQTSARKSNRSLQNREPRRIVRRLIRKSGRLNIAHGKIPLRSIQYIRDFANTMVNSRWRWTIITLTLSFVSSWLVFAFLYMVISQANGDLDKSNPTEYPCITGVQGFIGYFLFSVETQTTIGYGTRYVTHNCPESTFLVSFQLILGFAICGVIVSIVYTKMIRPVKMHSTRLFSRNSVICQRDGILCLIFRVRDEDSRYCVGTEINAYLVQSRIEEPFLKTISLEPSGILLWPLEIIHKITPTSPFWDLSAKDLITKRFELIVKMQGTSVLTGQCSKTRTSYLSTEILWGHRFKQCVYFDNDTQSYVINHKEFHKTEEVLTPLCSAQRLLEVIEEISSPVSSPVSTKLSLSPWPEIKEESESADDDNIAVVEMPSDTQNGVDIQSIGVNTNATSEETSHSTFDIKHLISSLENYIQGRSKSQSAGSKKISETSL